MFESFTNLIKSIFNIKKGNIFYYRNIKIINSGDDLEKIINILKKTEPKILNYVTLIRVYDEMKIPIRISRCVESWGTAVRTFVNDKLLDVEIYLVSSKFRNQPQIKNVSIEDTLNHELGHVYDAMIRGYIDGDEENQEIIADNYANQHM